MSALLTDRYDDALTYARQLHRDQTRKGAGIPYISHLMSVSSMVLEMGGDEDAAIAALLHDAVEDQDATFESVQTRFGPQVREIVELCTDASERPKPRWLPRKQAYLRRMAEKAAEPARYAGYLRVALADKLHNARSTRADIWNDGGGVGVFELFQGAGPTPAQRRTNTLAYYSDILRILGPVDLPSPGFRWYREELGRVVTEIGGGPELTLLP
ncbi:MAG: HD domain-containing protein [Acidimicrobiia bacterium]